MELKEQIKKRKVSQRQLAKEIGISERQMSRYATGEQEATEKIIIRLCNALGCTADELLGRDKKTPSDDSEGAEEKERERTVIVKTMFNTVVLPRVVLNIILIIIAVIIAVSIQLLIIRALLCFPPIRHLAQSIYRAISGRD